MDTNDGSKEKRQRKNYLKFTSDKCKNAALKERRTGTLNDWDVTECRQMNVCSNALYISYMYYFCQVEKRFLFFSFEETTLHPITSVTSINERKIQNKQ